MTPRSHLGYVTPSQVSRYLGVHYELVRAWMREGRLEVMRDGRFHLVSIDSVMAIAEELGIDLGPDPGRVLAGGDGRPGSRERPDPPSGRFKPTVWPGRRVSRCGRCGGNVVGGSCLQCGHEPGFSDSGR